MTFKKKVRKNIMEYADLFIGIVAVVGVSIFLLLVLGLLCLIRAYDEYEKWG